MKGKFITFEGCDGCGKSTQLKLLSEYLTANGIPHIFTREPGGGKISEAIREILLSGKNSEMTDECEALLYAASRVQHLSDRVEPALAERKACNLRPLRGFFACLPSARAWLGGGVYLQNQRVCFGKIFA